MSPISVGRYNGVWFGPRRRAQALLQQFRREVIPIHDAIRWLQEALSEYPGVLEKVRWVDQELDKDRFRFTIAICYTQPLPKARHQLFELGQAMVEATGWYPMVLGEPLGSGRQAGIFHQQLRKHALPRIRLGEIAIQDATGKAGGCAIRLRIGDNAILLDSGYARSHAISEADRLVWISHAHADHSQGWTKTPQPPLAVMTDETARVLYSLGRIDSQRLSGYVKVLSLNPDSDWYELGRDVRLRPFAVPHYPGAAGLEVQVGDTNLFYTAMFACVPRASITCPG